MPEEVLLDLAQPRTVLLQDRGRTFTLHCRRVTDADWLAYFSSIIFASEQDGKNSRVRINTIDVASPRLALAASVLIGAEGYKLAGEGSLTDLPGWQTKIPLAHRAKLGETLADVRPAHDPDAGFTIYPEVEIALLDATWSAESLATEVPTVVCMSMRRFEGLKHVLKTPTEEQHRRYARESSRSRQVGGSRTGRTVYQPAQPLLAKLYDELVVSVEGYSVGGVALTDDVQQIRSQMDMLHKVMAAQEVFQPADTSALAGTGTEDVE